MTVYPQELYTTFNVFHQHPIRPSPDSLTICVVGESREAQRIATAPCCNLPKANVLRKITGFNSCSQTQPYHSLKCEKIASVIGIYY